MWRQVFGTFLLNLRPCSRRVWRYDGSCLAQTYMLFLLKSAGCFPQEDIISDAIDRNHHVAVDGVSCIICDEVLLSAQKKVGGGTWLAASPSDSCSLLRNAHVGCHITQDEQPHGRSSYVIVKNLSSRLALHSVQDSCITFCLGFGPLIFLTFVKALNCFIFRKSNRNDSCLLFLIQRVSGCGNVLKGS